MNHTASGFLILEKAIEVFFQFKIAEGLSQNTITAYKGLYNGNLMATKKKNNKNNTTANLGFEETLWVEKRPRNGGELY